MCGSNKVAAVIPVSGRLPLLEQTLRRLKKQSFPLHSVVCVGGTHEEKAVCEANGAVFCFYRNYPLGAKWQFGVDIARNLGANAILYVGSSDWVSDNWVETLLEHDDENAGILGVHGGLFVRINPNGSFDHACFAGYDDEGKRTGEPMGAGRLVMGRALERMNWQIFDVDADNSLDHAQFNRVKESGFEVRRIDILDIADAPIHKVAIETFKWKNKHSIEKAKASQRLVDSPVSDDFILHKFPELKDLMEDSVVEPPDASTEAVSSGNVFAAPRPETINEEQPVQLLPEAEFNLYETYRHKYFRQYPYRPDRYKLAEFLKVIGISEERWVKSRAEYARRRTVFLRPLKNLVGEGTPKDSRPPISKERFWTIRKRIVRGAGHLSAAEKIERRDRVLAEYGLSLDQWKHSKRVYLNHDGGSGMHKQNRTEQTESPNAENGATARQCTKCFYGGDMRIVLHSDGECDYCKLHRRLEKEYPQSWDIFNARVDAIKQERRGKYDCLVGLSGGCDSSYFVHLLMEQGVNPLVFHWDNGWDTEEAKSNIRALQESLGFEMITIEADDEYHELNKALLHASTNDADIPNDIAMTRLGYDLAKKHNIKYILHGSDFRSESPTPVNWTFMDSDYLKKVYRWYTGKELETFPLFPWSYQVGLIFSGIKKPRLMFNAEYDKSEAKRLLSERYGWKDYGSNHSENIFTFYVGSYLLPKKFGIDKRRLYLSAEVRSGTIDYAGAQEKLEQPPELPQEYLDMVVARYFGSKDEHDEMFRREPRKFYDFVSSQKFERAKPLLWIMMKMGAVPMTYYRKYTREVPRLIEGNL